MTHSISIFGRAILTGAAAGAILVMVGCGASENGAVIGVPPTANVSVTSSQLSLTGLEKELAAQLSAADQSLAGNQQLDQLSSQVDALVNDQSLLLSERISALKQIGAAQISQRESKLQGLAIDVRDTAGLGSNEYAILNVIDQTEGALQTLAAKISSDTLIDVLRGDVLSIEISSRVDGLVSPQVHVALAGDTLANQASTLSGVVTTLGSEIQSTDGVNIGIEEQLLYALQADLGPMQSTGSSVASQVLQLTPAGYPGNKSTLSGLKSEVAGVELGDGASAQGDAATIKTCLSDDLTSMICSA